MSNEHTSAPQDQQVEAVRAHIQKMQSYVREYLEPGPYVAKHGKGGMFNEPHPHQDEAHAYFMRQQMREAVLNDLIYMLDGPEERAALAHPAPQAEAAPSRDEALRAENERLRAALEFYADRNFNGYEIDISDYGLSMRTGEIIKDAGDQARAALAERT